MGYSVDEMFPSRFLKAGDLRGKAWTVRIAHVSKEEPERDPGRDEEKDVIWVVHLHETKKLWRLNKTNALCIKAMFGDDSDGWLEKHITLLPEQDPSGRSEDGLCIRVLGSPDIDWPVEVKIRVPVGRFRAKIVKRLLRITRVPQRLASNTSPPQESDSGL